MLGTLHARRRPRKDTGSVCGLRSLGAEIGASSGSHRAAWGSALPEAGKRAILRVRETGFARQLGYDCPADLVERYPEFYWHSVAPHIGQAVAYLNVTASVVSGLPISTITYFALSTRPA